MKKGETIVMTRVYPQHSRTYVTYVIKQYVDSVAVYLTVYSAPLQSD